ncbi:MAG: VCBS repeat-containing protein [Thermodesulforhabdaceae bacterium]
MRKPIKLLSTFSFIFAIIGILFFGWGTWTVSENNLAAAQQSSSRIAVAPFSIQAPPDLAYLQKGVQNLLVSRVNVPGKIDTIPINSTPSGLTPGASLNPEETKKISSTVGGTHLIVGTITAIGESVSIDAWLYDLLSGGAPKKFSVQGGTISQVIPQVDQMAKEIGSALGATPVATTTPTQLSQAPVATAQPQQGAQSRVMEVLANPLLEEQKISYLNPNFIEITPEESLQNLGVWRSQTISEGIVGMDVGDVDGDGIPEIVTLSYKKLSVYKRIGTALKLIATYEADKLQRLVWCSVIDLNGDKRAEIVVTAMVQKNVTSGGYMESMTGVATGHEIPSSVIFSLQGTTLQPIATKIPFFLNTFTTATGEKILIGQRQATEKGFAPNIHEMRLQGQKLEPLQEIHLPSKCNVFNCAEFDADGDSKPEYVIILPDNRMILTRANGSVMWKSRHRFGATTNYILGKAEDLRYNQQDYYYIPPPMLVTDLNKDNQKEIVVNRSPEYSRLLPAGFKYYEAGQVVSLSWDQIGLIENWATRELSGMVTSLRIADTNNDGTPELVVSVVLGKELLQVWKSESVIFAYDLNVDRKVKNKAKESR